jgi:hypothetical protein
MKYLLQVRFNGADRAMAELPDHERAATIAEFEALGDVPGLLDRNQLQPAATARTVRVRDGETHVTSGPPDVEAGLLDGYYLLDAPDPQAAVAVAQRIPVLRWGATVEIRPVVER